MLTGQRRGEVAGMRRDEIDLDKALWSMPGTRTKNGRPHVIPLCNQAVAILRGMTQVESDYVFTATADRAITAFVKVKKRLDLRMPATPAWTLHDIRRTCATGMADIGIQPHIIEAVLNHVSGHRAGVAGVYNRAAYAAKRPRRSSGGRITSRRSLPALPRR